LASAQDQEKGGFVVPAKAATYQPPALRFKKGRCRNARTE